MKPACVGSPAAGTPPRTTRYTRATQAGRGRERTSAPVSSSPAARTVAPAGSRKPNRSDEAFDLLREVCRNLLGRCAETGQLRPGLGVEPESARLRALVDGLLLHGVLHPDRAGADDLRDVLRRHLDRVTDTAPV